MMLQAPEAVPHFDRVVIKWLSGEGEVHLS